MNGKRRNLLVLSLPLLASFVWFAMPRSDPRAENTGGLEIAMVSPRGDTEALHSIDVVFSEAMVPLGGRLRGKIAPPLAITPAIPGSFSWIGSRVLSFVPRSDIPPGTRLTCRVPEGIRSLEGKETSADYAWEIVVGRPRLLASVPGDKGLSGPDEPLYLLFNAVPAPGAVDSIRLVGPAGRIPLRRVTPDSLAIAQLLPRDERRGGTDRILALAPGARIPGGQKFRLEIGAGIPFVSSDASMRAPVAIAFETYGPPAPRSMSVDLSGFALTLAGPVDPAALRDRVSFDPPIAISRIHPLDANTVRIDANLRPGTEYALRLAAGLTSLLGETMTEDAIISVRTPHRPPDLTLFPSEGYVPWDPRPSIRIAATNVDSVEVWGAWVDPDSVPNRLTDRRRLPGRPKLPRIALWLEPGQTPDSARAIHLPLTRFGAPPRGGQVLQIRVRARPLFPFPDEGGRLLQDQALIQITDLGLSTVSGNDRGLAWVTSLSSGQPVASADVLLLYPGQKTPLWRGMTDGDGLVWLPGLSELSLAPGAPLVAEVRTAKDAAWLDLPTYAIDRRRSDPGGEIPNHRASAFTDRPLYRPGEVVRWVAHVRATGREGIKAAAITSVNYSITGPSGQQIDSGRTDLTPPGLGSGSFAIPIGAPLGSYSIEFSRGEGSERIGFSGAAFNVQEFRLPRFEARLSAPSSRALSGSTVMIEGRFAYLGGGPLAGAPVRWTLSRHPDWSRPEGFWDFSFQDDRPRGMESRMERDGTFRVASGEGTLDTEGQIRLPVTPDLSSLSEDQVFLLEMGARDLADRSAYDVVSFHAQRAAYRIGARSRLAPNQPRARAAAGAKERVEFAAIVFDSTDSAVPGVSIRWTIEKRDWKTVRVRRIGGVFGYENVPLDSLLASGTGRSAGEPSSFLWDPPSAGSYSFTVETTDPQGRTTRARDIVYVSGSESAAWYREDGGWMELKPDKTEYAPGDTARILIPAPAIPTEGLVLVLDDGIRSVRRLRKIEGSPRIGIPLSGSFPPGVSVQAILVGPTLLPQGSDGRQRLPYHGWGSTSLGLEMDDWRLAVDLAADRSAYEPGDSVRVLIQVRDAKGNPAEGTVTLAVVDDAIFELTGADKPDPLSSFFEWRGPGVDYSDVRFHLRVAPTGEKGELTPGGDGAGTGVGLRKRFTPTVHWEPSARVGSDGRAVVRFRLSDDLTRYRFRALAASGVDLFGYGETTADVRKPIMIEAATPRFVREGDKIEIAASVRSRLAGTAEVRLSAEAVGARIEGKAERKVKVPAGGATRAVFSLRDPGREGVRLTLRASGAGREDAIEIAIPTDKPYLWDREFLSGRADPSFVTTVETEGTVSPDRGGLTIVASPSLLGGLTDALAYTIDYPYGCLEQLASSLLGLVAAGEIARRTGEDLPAVQRERAVKTAAAIDGIRQCAESWRLQSWPSADSPDASDYTAGYALHAATRARASGIPFPRPLWDRLGREADERLRQLLSLSDEGRQGSLQRLLRDGPWLLWTMSEADRLLPQDSVRVRLDTAEALYARRSSAPIESRLILGLAMESLSNRPGADAIRRNWPNMAANLIGELRSEAIQRTGRHVWVRSADPLWGDGLGSGLANDVRMTALFLSLLARTSPSDGDLAGLVAWLLDHRQSRSGGWANQHMTALTLDLLVSTVAALEGPSSQVSVKVAVGTNFENFRFLPGRNAVSRRFTPISELIASSGERMVTPLRVETDGRRVVYVSGSLDAAIPALDAPPREEGLIVDRTYVSRDGQLLAGEIPLGEPFFAHLAVVVSRDAKTLMIEDPLPGGIETLNLSFQNAPRVSMAAGPSENAGEEGEDEEAAGAGYGGGRHRGGGLWIVHREMRDRAVRLFAEDVRAGVYHVYYPVIAATAGEYRTPGARAELLYSPEIYGVSAPQTVRIVRQR